MHDLRRGHCYRPAMLLFFIAMVLAACGGGSSSASSVVPALAVKQVLTFPYIGASDNNVVDPTLDPEANSNMVMGMIYTGLVKTDKDLNILPDQATWKVSPDNKVYTFTIAPDVAFSDGAPVTAQAYVASWMHAIASPNVPDPAALFVQVVAGASEMSSGKAQTVSGLKALDARILQVTLMRPAPYFLAVLTNSLFFPLNQAVLASGQHWAVHVTDGTVGTGPFIVKEWDHNVKMVFTPNPHYYGKKTGLAEVDMLFVNDASTAFKAYRAGQYDFVWGLTANDQVAAKSMPGFLRAPLLQTDALFFDTTMPPFNDSAMRQAFAYATDKVTLAHSIFKDSAVAAHTILPPGMPGYQSDFVGLPFDGKKAKEALQSVYADTAQIPPITFSYPSAQFSSEAASALQQMWQGTLGVQVTLRPLELTTYLDEMQRHVVQLGFAQWSADFPDPYSALVSNLFSTSLDNVGRWSNPDFDQIIIMADTLSGEERLAFYNKAEQVAISDVGWLPLDHQEMAAVVSPWVHGVALNGEGLVFGDDWSGVYVSQH